MAAQFKRFTCAAALAAHALARGGGAALVLAGLLARTPPIASRSSRRLEPGPARADRRLPNWVIGHRASHPLCSFRR
jgi:hypothetical protein